MAVTILGSSGRRGRTTARRRLRAFAPAALVVAVVAGAPLAAGAASANLSAAQRITVPANHSSSNFTVHLSGVACPSTTHCVAVGSYTAGSPIELEPMVVSEANGTWTSATATAVPKDAYPKNPGALLTAVGCATSSTCVAVGSYSDHALHTPAWSITLSGGTWGHPVQIRAPSGAAADPNAEFSSISCPSVNACIAVGSYVTAQGQERPMVAVDGPSGWGRAIAVVPPANLGGPAGTVTGGNGGGTLAGLEAVSCVSKTTCAAVGTYTTTKDLTEGMFVTSGANGWARATEIPAPPGAAADPNLQFGGIACPAAATCEIAGGYATNLGSDRGFLRSEVHGTWSSATLVTPPPDAPATTDADLTALSCPSVGECFASGQYRTGDGPQAVMDVVEHHGVWAPAVSLELPSDYATDPQPRLADVACRADALHCAVVGVYVANGGRQTPFGFTG